MYDHGENQINDCRSMQHLFLDHLMPKSFANLISN